MFRRRRFLAGTEATELRWFTPAGTPMDGADWADPSARALAIYLDGSDDPDRAEDGTPLLDDDFLVLVNAWWEPLGFVLPPTRAGAEWQAEIDSYDPAAPAGAAERHAGDQVTVGPRSVAVLRATPIPGAAGRELRRSAESLKQVVADSDGVAVAVRAGLTTLVTARMIADRLLGLGIEIMVGAIRRRH